MNERNSIHLDYETPKLKKGLGPSHETGIAFWFIIMQIPWFLVISGVWFMLVDPEATRFQKYVLTAVAAFPAITGIVWETFCLLILAIHRTEIDRAKLTVAILGLVGCYCELALATYVIFTK